MSEETMPQSDLRPLTSDIRPLTSSHRAGVVICDCGDKIAGILDTEVLRRQAAALPEVVYAARDAYPCSKDGQARLRQAIAEQRLDRVLIAGCAPRLVEKLFQQTAQSAGLNDGYLEVTDIREQCAYVHGDDPAALQKAADLIEMGVARLVTTTPSSPHTGRVVKSAMVIGSDLSGLTAALSLSDNNIPVTLVEQANALGGSPHDLSGRERELIAERSKAASHHSNIQTLLNAHVIEVTGHPGDYQVRVAQNSHTTTFAAGAIIVATRAHPQELGTNRWYDRSRVVTQAQFEQELGAVESGGSLRLSSGRSLLPNDIVMILCAQEPSDGRCSRVCCMDAIRQAIRARQYNPNANVTILFRDLYLGFGLSSAEGGAGDQQTDEFQQAVELGVTFFRYRKGHLPKIGDPTIDVHDTLTGETVRLPYDRAVLAMPLVPQDDASLGTTRTLAALLRVPQDESGFMIEPRVRLRPGRYTDDGVYVLGGAHQPADTAETLFQAYMTSSRVQRFLSQDSISVKASTAQIDAKLCTGCGNCAQVCPTLAITLEKRDGGVAATLSLSDVDPLRCTGCGNCAVVCPVKAITLPGWGDAEILAQISAALRRASATGKDFGELRLRRAQSSRRVVVALACEWSAYAAADMAGARHMAYPPDVCIIRMNCSARFDPYHVLWAFINGAAGVFLGACPPGECHYGTGNLYAKERVEVLKKLLAEHGIDPRRLRLEFLAGDDGRQFAKTMTGFVTELKELAEIVRVVNIVK